MSTVPAQSRDSTTLPANTSANPAWFVPLSHTPMLPTEPSGTVVAFALQGLLFTAVYTLLSYIEDWTQGYGMNAHMFSNVYMGSGPLWERVFTTFGAFMFCFALGALAGSVFVRWRATGLYALGGVVALLTVGFIAVSTLTDSWPAVGGWFVEMRTVGVVAWLLIPMLVSAVIGYFVLRKAPSRT